MRPSVCRMVLRRRYGLLKMPAAARVRSSGVPGLGDGMNRIYDTYLYIVFAKARPYISKPNEYILETVP